MAAPDDQIRHQRAPPRLVHGPQAGAVVTVEVFEEEQVLAPARVALELLDRAVDRPSPVLAGQPDRDQPATQVRGDLVQRQLMTGPGRVLDQDPVADLFAEPRESSTNR